MCWYSVLVEHGGERGVTSGIVCCWWNMVVREELYMLAGVVCWYSVLVECGGERGVMLAGVVCWYSVLVVRGLLVDNIVVREELCLLVLCAGIVCWWWNMVVREELCLVVLCAGILCWWNVVAGGQHCGERGVMLAGGTWW